MGIKRQPWDFSHKQLLGEVERGEQDRPLFDLSLRVIDTPPCPPKACV